MFNWIKNLFASTPAPTFTDAEWEAAHAENKVRTESTARAKKVVNAVVKSIAPAKKAPAKKPATPKAASGKRGRSGKK